MTAILRADSVGKSYRSRRILSCASVAAMPGTITFVLGRNGAGKSTLLEIAAGWIAPDTGTVQLDGEGYPRARLHELARKGVFYLRERGMFSPSFTLRQHFRAVEARYGRSDAGTVDEVAAAVGISDRLDDRPGTLSGGERRRAELALVLVRSPRCLLADEPIRGISPKDAELILAGLQGLASRGCGIVLTGHELSFLFPAADRVVWLTGGVTREFASLAEAQRDPRLRREFLMDFEVEEAGRTGASDAEGAVKADSSGAEAATAAADLMGRATEEQVEGEAAEGNVRRDAVREGKGDLAEADIDLQAREKDGGLGRATVGTPAPPPPGSVRPLMQRTADAPDDVDPAAGEPTAFAAALPTAAGPQRLCIDEQTLKDLEVFESAAGGQSLFNLLDHTKTTGGRVRLRRRFRQPSSAASEIIETQGAVRFILDQPALFGAVPDEATLKEVQRYLASSYTTSPRSSVTGRMADVAWHRFRYPDLFQALHRGVGVTVDLLRSMNTFVNDVAAVDAPGAAGVPGVIWRLFEPISTLLDAPEVWRLRVSEPTRRIAARDVLSFDHLLRERLRASIERVIEAAHELDALRSMALATGAYDLVLPTILAEPRAAPNRRSRVAKPSAVRNEPPQVAEPEAVPNELLHLTEPEAVPNELLHLTEPEAVPNEQFHLTEPEAVPNEQAHTADRKASQHPPSRRPHADAHPRLRIEGLFHPFVSEPVPNHFGLDGGSTLIFLTGPNMAGKTTYLKSCALCVYFAQLGMGVPAARMEVAPFDALFSSINTVDNVRLGYSYFFNEVRRVKEAVALLARGKRTFAVFDELFKGTNVRDAYDASRAVITGFARCGRSTLLVASHLAELAEELADLESVRLQHFEADIQAGEPVYDYTLKDGSSSQRLGMVLLESEEVLAMLQRLGAEDRE